MGLIFLNTSKRGFFMYIIDYPVRTGEVPTVTPDVVLKVVDRNSNLTITEE